MPQKSIPVSMPGGTNSSVKILNSENAVNQRSEVSFDATNLPLYQVTLLAGWPYTILVDIYPRDEYSVDTVREHIGIALAEAQEYLPQQISRIERMREASIDRAAPERFRSGISYGHSMGPGPIFLDVRIDPYAVKPEYLAEKMPAITEWLISALQMVRKEAAE